MAPSGSGWRLKRSSCGWFFSSLEFFLEYLKFGYALAPNMVARQTLAIFSDHDPQEVFRRFASENIKNIINFYRWDSSRKGALSDLAHTVGEELFKDIKEPTLIIHSREDKSVPFSHPERSLAHIPNAELYEGGFMGHLNWIGPDYQRINQRLVDFILSEKAQYWLQAKGSSPLPAESNRLALINS